MPDFSPSWDTIANTLVSTLKTASGIADARYRYPDNAIADIHLPCVVVSEPSSLNYEAFTFGAFTVRYIGVIDLLVKAVPVDRVRLGTGEVDEIMQSGLILNQAVMANRRLNGLVGNISLGDGALARFSPYDQDNRGNYAGLQIPYNISVQYRS